MLGLIAWIVGGLAVCWAVGALLVLAGRSARYRYDQPTEVLRQICLEDYGLDVAVRQEDRTLAVHLHHAGILQQVEQRVDLAPSANELLGNVIEAVHRVVLVSDSPIEFYVLFVSDPAVPGAYLTLMRYVDDVKRVASHSIAPTEFFARTILDLRFAGAAEPALEHLAPRDIQLEEFLSWQLAQRIQVSLARELERHGLAGGELGPCVGDYREGEFVFTLNVAPAPSAAADDDRIQQIFQTATSVIARVLADYRFERFSGIRLIHPPTGRSLLLPRAQLEIFR